MKISSDMMKIVAILSLLFSQFFLGPQTRVFALSPMIPPPLTGSLSGILAYPSDAIPPLSVYAFQSDDYSKFQKIETVANQAAFTIPNLTPGSYVVVAYPKEAGTLRGGFTKAVSCGLLATCTDHSLIKVKVEAGKTSSGVEVKDWYAPDNAFPPQPR